MSNQASSAKRKPSSGNRRNPHTHEAIIKATLELLKSVHYHALTIEAIASRAQVGKATVYRWWPSKGALVAEAIHSSLPIEEPPDTGDLRADLAAATKISVNAYARDPGGILITALATDLITDPDLHQSFVKSVIQPRRNILRNLLQRAVGEGLVAPGLDPELVMDMWAGAVLYRKLLAMQPVDDQFASQLLDAFLAENRVPAPPISGGE